MYLAVVAVRLLSSSMAFTITISELLFDNLTKLQIESPKTGKIRFYFMSTHSNSFSVGYFLNYISECYRDKEEESVTLYETLIDYISYNF